jgi:hypothetical protein
MTHTEPLQTGETLRHDGSSGIGEGTSPDPGEHSTLVERRTDHCSARNAMGSLDRRVLPVVAHVP